MGCTCRTLREGFVCVLSCHAATRVANLAIHLACCRRNSTLDVKTAVLSTYRKPKDYASSDLERALTCSTISEFSIESQRVPGGAQLHAEARDSQHSTTAATSRCLNVDMEARASVEPLGHQNIFSTPQKIICVQSGPLILFVV